SLLTLATKLPVPGELSVAGVSLYPTSVVGNVNLSASAGAAATTVARASAAANLLVLIILHSFQGCCEASFCGGGSLRMTTTCVHRRPRHCPRSTRGLTGPRAGLFPSVAGGTRNHFVAFLTQVSVAVTPICV